jgi:hypothetical protein
MNLERVHYHEAQCQADGYCESPSTTERQEGHHPIYVYIHDDGKRVHVHVMHHDAELEHHIYDFGDPAILRTLNDYYGMEDPANGTF